MLTNTERQAIVEEVNAGTYGIDEALDDIAAAQKGEEVRKALYAEALVLNREGHAGSTDMIARQQIANLQTSVNGQISTLRTEVGDDIDDLETALNSGIATQNGKIAAQDATIANVVANYNVEYGSTELWASTGETGALAAGTTVTLSEDVSHFDYIDIYSFCGNSNVLDTVPVDANLQTGTGYALRWINLTDPGSGTYEAYVRIVETKIHINGTTLTINHQVTYKNGANTSIGGVEVTSSNKSTYMGEFGIMKVVGRKITANTEVEDIRTGADGTAYNSAGAAVRAQVQALSDMIEDSASDIGNKTDLETDAKTDLVSAINEVNERFDSLSGGGIRAGQWDALISLLRGAIYDTSVIADPDAVIDDLEDSVDRIPSTGIALSTSSLTFSSGTAQAVTATLTPSYTTDGIAAVSSSSSIATVSVSGRVVTVTPVGNGNATITITTSSGLSATVSVAVSFPQSYSVTNTLTGCTSSNSSTVAYENENYSATITANTDYTISSVSVTMGGTDITATAWNSATGAISVASVTGNIAITAVATSPVLYSLAQPYIASGESDNYINTNLYLAQTDQSFTLVCYVKFDLDAHSMGDNKKIVYLGKPTNNAQFHFDITTAAYGVYCPGVNGGKTPANYNHKQNIKVVIWHTAGELTINSKIKYFDQEDPSATNRTFSGSTTLSSFTACENPLYIGKRADNYGICDSLTVQSLKVFNYVMDSTEIDAYIDTEEATA